jgi:hypothetical protein
MVLFFPSTVFYSKHGGSPKFTIFHIFSVHYFFVTCKNHHDDRTIFLHPMHPSVHQYKIPSWCSFFQHRKPGGSPKPLFSIFFRCSIFSRRAKIITRIARFFCIEYTIPFTDVKYRHGALFFEYGFYSKPGGSPKIGIFHIFSVHYFFVTWKNHHVIARFFCIRYTHPCTNVKYRHGALFSNKTNLGARRNHSFEYNFGPVFFHVVKKSPRGSHDFSASKTPCRSPI